MNKDLSRSCCPNSECPGHGKSGIGDPTSCGRYGKHKQHRLSYCHTRRYRYSDRKRSPLFGSQRSVDKADNQLHHPAERNGDLVPARLIGVNPNTGIRYSRLAGEHARRLHDVLIALSPGDP